MPLGHWVCYVRGQRRTGKLDSELARRLDELGFTWVLRRRTVYRLDWDVMVAALTAFKNRYGHCRVPRDSAKYRALGYWLTEVRRRKRKGLLDRERIRQLDKLGVVWEPRNENWEPMFADLVAYRAEHGDCNVPSCWPKNPRLGRWVVTQRGSRKMSTITQDHFQRLDKIGFVWVLAEEAWESNYAALVEFQRKHGHCRVSTLSKDHASLGNWVRLQRGRRRRGQLSQERIRSLHKLGFSWGVGKRSRASWESMYEALAAYQRVHGHCRVPNSNKNPPGFGYWVIMQRRARGEGKLSAEQIRRLDELGFSWDVRLEVRWQSMYEALAAFQRAHGHCGVSSREYPCLKRWVDVQRHARRRRKLSAERVRRLDELGFSWDTSAESQWESMHEALAAFQRAHGHCRVSSREYPHLKRWVDGQRRARRTQNLSAERARRLDELGFVWNPRDEKWERMLAKLVKYKNAHGNCNVPTGWPPDPKLAAWVSMQRHYGRRGTLPPHRRKRLRELGIPL